MAAEATQGVGAEETGSRFSHAWRALKHRNFKLFVAGQSISLIGTWMTRLATSWLVWRLTHSAMLLGVVGFSGQILTFVLAPFAGVLIERMDRRKLLVWTQALAGLQSLAMAWLTLAKVITIHEIIALSALQGLINAFDMPGRQSFLVQMVESKRDLGNAIALNSSMVNGARLIGPALAGIVIAAVGEGWCFAIDGVSYGAVIISLLMMQVKPLRHPSRGGQHAGTVEGRLGVCEHVSTDPHDSAAVCAVEFNGLAVRRVVADVCGAGAAWRTAYAWIPDRCVRGGSAGQRAFTGGEKERAWADDDDSAGCGDVWLGIDSVWIEPCSVDQHGADAGGRVRHDAGLAASNTVIQTLVPEDKRSRVMSYYTMAFVGMAPFGSLLAGGLAHYLGAPHTVMITGACCLLGSCGLRFELPAVRKIMRPIYVEMGIIPGAQEQAIEERA